MKHMAQLNIITAAATDIGIRRKSNQDSFSINIAETGKGRIAQLVVCDGVGGLSAGELASGHVVASFDAFFNNEVPNHLRNLENLTLDFVQNSWHSMLSLCNEKIIQKGNEVGGKIGTTITALFMFESGECLIVNIGDSRCYLVNKNITQLTNDHTLAALAVREGRMTKEDAAVSKSKSVLLQCVGANDTLEPEYHKLTASENDLFLLCSDGFRGKISDEEILRALSKINTEAELKKQIDMLIEEAKKRGERDNITAAAMKLMG